MAYFGNRKIRVEASDLVDTHGRKFKGKTRGRAERAARVSSRIRNARNARSGRT